MVIIAVTSTNSRISEAITILQQIPVFVSMLKELEPKVPKGLHILVEFGIPDTHNELGQTSKLSKYDISDSSTVDFYKAYRDIGVPDSTMNNLSNRANNWEKVFQGKNVNTGARVYLVRVTEAKDVYQLAETVAHEIGAHVRGWLLKVADHHNEWGTPVCDSAPVGTLARTLMDQLAEHKKKHEKAAVKH